MNTFLQNIFQKKLSGTSSGQLLDHSMVLCLWEGGSVIIGVAHHHPQLHGLGNLSAIWTLHHNADLKLTSQKEKHNVCLQSFKETEWLDISSQHVGPLL